MPRKVYKNEITENEISRDNFIMNLAQALVIEMVKKEGKALPDYAGNAHKTATNLADLLEL